jgi:D-alanyl-D-alanine carboxypeptidase (penicillin-binding protein 5/6)
MQSEVTPAAAELVAEPVEPVAPAALPEVPAATAAAVTATGRRRGRGAHSKHHRRRWWVLVTVVVALALAAGGIEAARRINGPLAQPAVIPGNPASLLVTGTRPSLSWPTTGQGAVSLPSLGFTAQSGPETPVPVASLTKLTTAYVILKDHPVAPGASGLSITVSAADVAEYDFELKNDESSIPIQVGEVLTERQMLEALLVRSANDMAYSLAIWDAGSTAAFVVKMNQAAAALGATSTHYVDVSGYEPGSMSTPVDSLRNAAADMAIPTFAEVVDVSSVNLPLAGTVSNIVTEVGTDGVIGIKSGYTSQALACMVLAADRVIGGRPVLVLAAVLTQPVPAAIVPPPTPAPARTTAPTPTTSTTTTLPANDREVPDVFRFAGPVDLRLLSEATAAVVQFTVVTAGKTAGVATASWGGTQHLAEVVTDQGAWLAGWPSQRATAVTRLDPVPPGARVGRTVGQIVFSLGAQVRTVPLKLAGTVAEPSWWWRLVHN